jgi:ankyrin repeat protein
MARLEQLGVKDIFALIDTSDNARLSAYLSVRPQAAASRNLNNVSAILYAQYRRNHYAVRLLRDNLMTLDMWEAAALGEPQMLRMLLGEPRANVDALSPDGYTALQLASFFGREDVVTLLLERGADPNAVSANVARTSALHGAAAARHVHVIKLLLAAGSDVDTRQGNGQTPLDAALKHGDEELEILLASKEPSA